MRLKRLETKHITLQHIQNLGLNELNINYGSISKNGHNWNWLAEIQFKYKCCKFCMNIEMVVVLCWFSVWMIIWLAGTIHREIGLIRYDTEKSTKNPV